MKKFFSLLTVLSMLVSLIGISAVSVSADIEQTVTEVIEEQTETEAVEEQTVTEVTKVQEEVANENVVVSDQEDLIEEEEDESDLNYVTGGIGVIGQYTDIAGGSNNANISNNSTFFVDYEVYADPTVFQGVSAMGLGIDYSSYKDAIRLFTTAPGNHHGEEYEEDAPQPLNPYTPDISAGVADIVYNGNFQYITSHELEEDGYQTTLRLMFMVSNVTKLKQYLGESDDSKLHIPIFWTPRQSGYADYGFHLKDADDPIAANVYYGWTEANDGSSVTKFGDITLGIDLEATYESSFPEGFQGTLNPITFQYGGIAPVPAPEETTWENYTLTGWVKKVGGGFPAPSGDGGKYAESQLYTFTDSVYENITLMPVYTAAKKTVTFDYTGTDQAGNAGEGWSDGIYTVEVDYDTSVAIPDIEPTKTDNTFVGWSTTQPTGNPANDAQRNLFDFDTEVITDTTNLYPVFSPFATLSYELNGGVESGDFPVTNHQPSSYASIDDSRPTKASFAFLGWTLDETTGGNNGLVSSLADYNQLVSDTKIIKVDNISNTTVLMDGNKVLYALWATDEKTQYDPNGNYDENPYNPNLPDGKPDFDQVTVTYDKNIDGVTGDVSTPQVWDIGTDVVLDADGGALELEDAVWIGWSLSKQDLVTKDNYTSILSTIITGIDDIAEDKTVFAVWAKDVLSDNPDDVENPNVSDGKPDYEQYKITYNLNSASGSVTHAEWVFDKGADVTLESGEGLTKEDAAFIGWTETVNPATVNTVDGVTALSIFTSGTITSIAKDYTLYAAFADDYNDKTGGGNPGDGIPDYLQARVTFDVTDSDMQTVYSNVWVLLGTAVSKPVTDPTKEGYVFDGWKLQNESDENKYNFETLVITNIVLVPTWTDEPFEIIPVVLNNLGVYESGNETVLMGKWANEKATALSFLVRANGSADKQSIINRVGRFAVTAQVENSFNKKSMQWTNFVKLGASNVLEFTNANVTDTMILYNGNNYRLVTLPITDTVKSGIVDFNVIYYRTTDKVESINGASHRVIVVGDLNKDLQIDVVDHSAIYSLFKSYSTMPSAGADGHYVLELADVNKDGQISSLDHTIIYNMFKSLIITN
jgi:hypothetical protein